MNRDLILSGVVNSLVGTTFTAVLVVLAFIGRRLWMRYGPAPVEPRSKYTCPRCGETAVIVPVHEPSP